MPTSMHDDAKFVFVYDIQFGTVGLVGERVVCVHGAYFRAMLPIDAKSVRNV